MFLQLQAYWRQPVPFAPSSVIGGEIFTCHDLADLEAVRHALAGKQEPLVFRIARDGPDISRKAVDLDELIAEIEHEERGDRQRYHRSLLRADMA